MVMNMKEWKDVFLVVYNYACMFPCIAQVVILVVLSFTQHRANPLKRCLRPGIVM